MLPPAAEPDFATKVTRTLADQVRSWGGTLLAHVAVTANPPIAPIDIALRVTADNVVKMQRALMKRLQHLALFTHDYPAPLRRLHRRLQEA